MVNPQVSKPKARRRYDISDSPTLQHYITDFTTPFCGVMSHVNSGKTSCMCVKSQLCAMNQHPDSNGVRHSAHIFIRGTHGDLLRSTVRSFEQWVDPKEVNIRRSPPIGGRLVNKYLGDQNKHFPEFFFTSSGKRLPYMLGGWDPEAEEYLPGAEDVSGVRIGDIFSQGTKIDALFDFVPLDNPEWEAMLLGSEYTSAYFDEPDSMSNIDDVLTKLPTRLGRYPAPDIAPITSTQVNMAFNPPRRGSFTQEFFDPKNEKYGRKLYRVQPPFLMIPDPDEPNNFYKAQFKRNPDSEGVRYAGKGFKHWEDIINASLHDPDKIRRDVLGEWTDGSGGALIHPDFNVDRHQTSGLVARASHKLFVSLDWGLAGACIIAQQVEGGIHVIEEITPDNQMAHEFVKQTVIPHLNSEYRGFDIVITGDPSGRYPRDVGDGPFKIFEDAGFFVEDETSNDPNMRWSAVNFLLKYKDGLKINDTCSGLLDGFKGTYTFKKQTAGSNVKQADKTKQSSAYQDCLQAIALLIHGGYEAASSEVLGTERYGRSQNNLQMKPVDDFLFA